MHSAEKIPGASCHRLKEVTKPSHTLDNQQIKTLTKIKIPDTAEEKLNTNYLDICR